MVTSGWEVLDSTGLSLSVHVALFSLRDPGYKRMLQPRWPHTASWEGPKYRTAALSCITTVCFYIPISALLPRLFLQKSSFSSFSGLPAPLVKETPKSRGIKMRCPLILSVSIILLSLVVQRKSDFSSIPQVLDLRTKFRAGSFLHTTRYLTVQKSALVLDYAPESYNGLGWKRP